MVESIERSYRELLKAGVADTATTVGCTQNELAEIESQRGVQLPKTYRAFLASMGHRAGEFLVGTDIFFPWPLKLRDSAEQLLLTWKSTYRLKSSDFVFAMHQGYQFLFFDAALGDDPPVWYYIEEKTEPVQVTNSFSEWLAICVQDEIATLRDLYRE